MGNPELLKLVYENLGHAVKNDTKNIFYLLYYSVLEAVLLLVTPLASAFIINSVLAHATISIYVLSAMVIIVFLMISALQVLKSYMVEKFEQKIFVQNAIEVAKLAAKSKYSKLDKNIDKYMNYFFDVISIQKLFPVLLLTGFALLTKMMIGLLLLLIFDSSLFMLGVFYILVFSLIMLFLGRKGPVASIERSDAKHEAIYYIQDIPNLQESDEEIYEKLDGLLTKFVNKRNKMFSVIVKQLTLSYFSEGFILSSFFILGGYLVFEGTMPIGEFVAAEIIIISIIYALQDFVKQIDYIYDTIEGFYKINKLSSSLEKSANE